MWDVGTALRQNGRREELSGWVRRKCVRRGRRRDGENALHMQRSCRKKVAVVAAVAVVVILSIKTGVVRV
ncbi:hypothetical protein I7I48_06602 [Histoplasma ohiense]|nr:hypothetical protein I7I48_06602 [Histoplasma ohiense (nom. inval.)]